VVIHEGRWVKPQVSQMLEDCASLYQRCQSGLPVRMCAKKMSPQEPSMRGAPAWPGSRSGDVARISSRHAAGAKRWNISMTATGFESTGSQENSVAPLSPNAVALRRWRRLRPVAERCWGLDFQDLALDHAVPAWNRLGHEAKAAPDFRREALGPSATGRRPQRNEGRVGQGAPDLLRWVRIVAGDADPPEQPARVGGPRLSRRAPDASVQAASTLRRRQKHESVRLNYGSLYAVVASLEKAG
jgi:hypothetical protein